MNTAPTCTACGSTDDVGHEPDHGWICYWCWQDAERIAEEERTAGFRLDDPAIELLFMDTRGNA